jgi:hypothetical protein
MKADDPERLPRELIVFRSIQLLLVYVRFITLSYFTTQTIRHVKISQEEKGKVDIYTLMTFCSLGLSFLMFMIYRGMDIVLGFAGAINKIEGPDSYI